MKFDVSSAANQIALQNAAITQLWTVYVAANFAMAGFAFASEDALPIPVKVAVTVGFWAFALGHLALLRQTLRTAWAYAEELKAAITTYPPQAGGFQVSLWTSALSANRTHNSVAAHLLIDCCSTAALWLG